MEMRLNREDFLSTLEQLHPGLSPKEDVEQSSCFVFSGKRVMTYNDEIACWHRSPLKIEGAVAAKPLLALLHKMSEEEIRVSLKGDQLMIVGKRRKAGILMEKEIALPIDSVDKPETWKPLADDFTDAIQIVERCASTEESEEFHLTCVNLHPKWVEAANRLQVTRYRLQTGLTQSTLVRSSSIRHIIDMGMTEFAETENWIHFRNPQKLVMSCRRFMDDYPSLKQILNCEGQEAKLPQRLADAAERAQIFTSENPDDDQITVKLIPGKMTVVGRGPTGWYRESKSVKYDGKPIEFMVVPKMLAEIVKRHRSCHISETRLRVDGGKWTFVACLNPVIVDESGDGGETEEGDSDG